MEKKFEKIEKVKIADEDMPKEFNVLMQAIRREGLGPEYLQHIEDFDLKHKDAVPYLPLKDWAGV